MKQLNTKIVLRNDIYSAWESANPILLKGEVGVEYNPDVRCNHHDHHHGENHTCGEHGCGGNCGNHE